MLDVSRNGHPRMHPFLVDRESRAWKSWIGERADRNDDCTIEAFQRVGDRRTTFRAQNLNVLLVPSSPTRTNSLLLPEIVTTSEENRAWAPKTTPGSSLAGQAVAHRSTDRLVGHRSLKLAAAA